MSGRLLAQRRTECCYLGLCCQREGLAGGYYWVVGLARRIGRPVGGGGRVCGVH